jgi:hypothetical protein
MDEVYQRGFKLHLIFACAAERKSIMGRQKRLAKEKTFLQIEPSLTGRGPDAGHTPDKP